MYAITGNEAYITHAITEAETLVVEAEQAIAQGERPPVSADSYLEAWWYIEQIALAYDYGYDRLTTQQRDRWRNYMEQTVYNIWNPQSAVWGQNSFPWTGWGTNDPGNNYFFGHIRTTMYVALALQNQPWIDFLQTTKFPQITAYYANIPGGGSREGTGYGTALGNLFEVFRLWKSSTGEDLATQTSHTRDTLNYWVHATVPTGDRFAAIGDQSRVSNPEIFDYHRNLMLLGMALSPNASQANHAAWWLNQIDLQENSQGFTLRPTLLSIPAAATMPNELLYHATGTGDLFVRSSWSADALWLAIKAGPFDQSHAHSDQGSFTLHKDTWLAVTSNVWSHSGIQAGPEVHNSLRFSRNGTIIRQNYSVSSMITSTLNGVTTVEANLSNAYSNNASDIQNWTRQFIFNPQTQTLRVIDACQVSSNVAAVFQIHTPVQPRIHSDGSIWAGKLQIQPGASTTVALVDMRTQDSDFLSGWRIELTNPNGCSYDVTLTSHLADPLNQRVYLPMILR